MQQQTNNQSGSNSSDSSDNNNSSNDSSSKIKLTGDSYVTSLNDWKWKKMIDFDWKSDILK